VLCHVDVQDAPTVIPSIPALPLLPFTRRNASNRFSRSHTSSPFRSARRVHNSTMAAFPEAPYNARRPNFLGPL
jgi:hypothetical protein